MLATVALALMGVSAAYYDTTELLLRKNVHDNYDVQKVCRVNKLQKWYRTENDEWLNNEEDNRTPFRRLDSERTQWKVNRCCNKFSVFEKKQCLRNVREQLLDTHCENGLTHVCCQTPGPQRYFCFTKNPFTTLRRTDLNRLETLDYTLNQLENFDETDNKYTRWEDVEDVLDEQRLEKVTLSAIDEVEYLKEKMYRPVLNTEEVYGETVLDIEEQDETEAVVPYPFGSRKCDNSNHCRHQLEKATRVVAKHTCLKNTMKAGQETTKTCCEAGALVGATAGKRHKNVCLPAVYKFQTKAQDCGVNHKPSCKVAFVSCCKQAKAERKYSAYKHDLVDELRTDKYETVVDELTLTTPFRAFW